jgi:hypothetical protein
MLQSFPQITETAKQVRLHGPLGYLQHCAHLSGRQAVQVTKNNNRSLERWEIVERPLDVLSNFRIARQHLVLCTGESHGMLQGDLAHRPHSVLLHVVEGEVCHDSVNPCSER